MTTTTTTKEKDFFSSETPVCVRLNQVEVQSSFDYQWNKQWIMIWLTTLIFYQLWLANQKKWKKNFKDQFDNDDCNI